MGLLGTGNRWLSRVRDREWQGAAVVALLTAVAFGILYAKPALLLVRDWWSDPEAGHGLLLFPVAVWSAWRSGLLLQSRPSPVLGLLLIGAAVMLRYASELAAELFTMRLSMVGAFVGLVLYFRGMRQVVHWWLPVLLLVLSIPLPDLVVGALALPLQFKASELGAMLLEWRHVPVRLTGNIILVPGHQLFVTEACSGLRSLTALLSLGVLIGGFWLSTVVGRVALVVVTIPIAVLINGIRVFLTGFLVFFVDPALGDGFMHLTEGWLLFVVSFALVGAAAAGLRFIERHRQRRALHA